MKKSYLYAGITIILWGTSSITIASLLGKMTGLQALFYEFLLASIFLFCVIAKQGKLSVLKQYKAKDYLLLILLGGLGIFAYNMLNTYSYKFATGTEAVAINYLWPLWIIVTSIFILKEKVTWWKIIATFISLFGMVLVVTRGDLTIFTKTSMLGAGMALLCGFCFGLFSTLTKKIKYDKTVAMFIYFSSSMIISLICILLFSSFPHITLDSGLWLFLRGIVQFGIAYLVWTLALMGDTVKIANLALLTPFLQLASLAIFAGEKVGILSILGLMLIISGTLIAQLEKEKNTA